MECLQHFRHGASKANGMFLFVRGNKLNKKPWFCILQCYTSYLGPGQVPLKNNICTQEEKACHSVEIDGGGLADRIDVWKPRGLVPASEHHSSSSITYFNKAFNFWFEHLTHPCWISVSSHSVFSDCAANKSSRWNRIQLTSAVPRHQPSLPSLHLDMTSVTRFSSFLPTVSCSKETHLCSFRRSWVYVEGTLSDFTSIAKAEQKSRWRRHFTARDSFLGARCTAWHKYPRNHQLAKNDHHAVGMSIERLSLNVCYLKKGKPTT